MFLDPSTQISIRPQLEYRIPSVGKYITACLLGDVEIPNVRTYLEDELISKIEKKTTVLFPPLPPKLKDIMNSLTTEIEKFLNDLCQQWISYIRKVHDNIRAFVACPFHDKGDLALRLEKFLLRIRDIQPPIVLRPEKLQKYTELFRSVLCQESKGSRSRNKAWQSVFFSELDKIELRISGRFIVEITKIL